MSKRAKLFANGRSQAVRLPKEFRFAGNEVNIERRGDAVILTPVESRWTRLARELVPLDQETGDLLDRIYRENRARPKQIRKFDW
ncbi:MAG: type II toxin-antitoxin system VapB family antitoxin [Gemmatimonadota bacterium]|nr:type II toxin-antitoxin system VapB family antitoxin [Gemmatimonadota bacterium]